ncbi:elongation factor EF-Ts [Candidatus Hodgkinia cicadicola]|uniref:Elongation factor EF-Ts n=1 Tax=Candidatus Hodgkinia cicadicola TaxID=573658 RepID=A0ABX4MH31_9HYPH|nr:elongation factor EF-Ts [Candidatus Hodgkinia cicadicola]PIM96059.1 elongation factor EF-Ts [Candidatus Hodgkinia cicadicola]PIM96270.1 elongation factor EF-Ts [Candidatus Hodgkinia cicadicola]
MDGNYIKLIITLRKQTGLSISYCKEVISKHNGNYIDALRTAQIESNRLLTYDVNGDHFISWIGTRFGLYIFKLTTKSEVYNNRSIWELRNKLNKIIQNHQLNSEKILNINVVNDLVIASCVGLKYSNNTFGLYFHEKINEFICKKFAISVISSYPCNRKKLIVLARIFSRQVLSYYVIYKKVVDIKTILKSECLYNTKQTMGNIINKFSSLNKCFVGIQRVFIMA